MKAQSTSPEGLIESSAGIQNKWTICAGVIGVSTLLLAGYQFVLMPLLEPADTAAGSAVGKKDTIKHKVKKRLL